MTGPVQAERDVDIHVDIGTIKTGAPSVKVSRAECGSELARGRTVRMTGTWDIKQYDAPRACLASVVCRPVSEDATWEVDPQPIPCPARPIVKADHAGVPYPCILEAGHTGPHRVRV